MYPQNFPRTYNKFFINDFLHSQAKIPVHFAFLCNSQPDNVTNPGIKYESIVVQENKK